MPNENVRRIVLALGVCVQSFVAAAEPTPAAIKNVLFIISDDLKASVLGCYGDNVCKTAKVRRFFPCQRDSEFAH